MKARRVPGEMRDEPAWRRYLHFWGRNVDADVEDELRFHLDMRAREYARLGLAPDDAHKAAIARFGDVNTVRSWLRDHDHHLAHAENRRETMKEFLRDLRYAVRGLAARPGFTTVAVVTLGLGIGITTAVFGVVNTVLIRPLPYRHAPRVAVLWNTYEQPAMPRAALSPAEFADFQEQLPQFEQMSAFADWTANLTGSGEPRRLQGFMVSPNLFSTLGATMARGRGFVSAAEEDAQTGATPAVVLSNELWRTEFGADPAILGRVLHLNGKAFNVVGVAPPGARFPDSPSFLFPDRADLWVAHDWAQDAASQRGNKWLRIVGRLHGSTSIEQAQVAVTAAASRMKTQFPDTYPEALGWRPLLVPLRDQIIGDVRPALGALTGAVVLVLLIACANVANLLLARGASRMPEVALRSALGASRGRIIRQMLTESLVLSLVGGALGILVAKATLGLLVRYGPASVPRLDQARLDPTVMAFALAVALLTAIVFGVAPALKQSRANLHALLKQGGRAVGGGAGRAFGGRLLVACEVALSLVVLVGAGLLLRTVDRLRATDIGFKSESVLTVRLSLPSSKYATAPARATFTQELLTKLSALPSVTTVGAGYPLPLTGDAWDGAFVAEDQAIASGQTYPNAEYGFVTPGFFRVLQVPLRAGRFFTEGDGERAPEIAIVDEKLAKQYWPGQSAVGKRLSLAGRPDSVWATVVGVVGHVRRAGARVEGGPQIYVPFAQRPTSSIAVAIRTSGNPLLLAPALREAIRGIDPDQPITALEPLSQLTARSTARDTFTLALLAVFAVLATFLAAVGLYGVMAAQVAQRTREIGVRMALGAEPGNVLRLIVGEGMIAVAAGLVLGAVAAVAASRALSSLLFGVASTDIMTYITTALLLAAVSLVACAVPAYRAAKSDPLSALRMG